MKLIFSSLLIILLSSQNLLAQDSLAVKKDSIDSVSVTHLPLDKAYQFNYKKLIIPAAFITYGVATLKFDKLKQLNYFSLFFAIFKIIYYFSKSSSK